MAATEPPLNPISAWLIVIARVVEGLGESLKNVQYPPGSWDPRDGDPLMPDPPPAPGIPDPVGERNRRLIPQAVKIAVTVRDGGRCRRCGSAEELHFDHVIPVSRGGANTVANIQLLCAPCNRTKGARRAS
jgi:hypothetical protein